MKLSNHQQEILEKSLTLLQNNRFLLIKGSAGVGKTFMVGELIRILSLHTIVAAPTHKALQVLREKINTNNMTKSISFRTLHSSLGLKRIITKGGKEVFKPDKWGSRQDPLLGCELYVIDEASMISSELLDLLEKASFDKDFKVIFLGDDKQLPPVGEKESKVFKSNYPTVTLTEVVRQAKDNPILSLALNLDLTNSKESKIGVGKDGKSLGYVYSNDKESVLKALIGNKDIRYLSFTNHTVDLVNKTVRERLFGNPRKVEEGEIIRIIEPYSYNGNFFHTDQEIEIENIKIKTKILQFFIEENDEIVLKDFEFKYYAINNKIKNESLAADLEDLDNLTLLESQKEVHELEILHEDSEELFQKLLNDLAHSAKLNMELWNKEKKNPWVESFFPLKEYFAQISYSYASTVHKSQGCTFDAVIVDIGDISRCFDKNTLRKLLYTAYTRPSRMLILFNYKKIKL